MARLDEHRGKQLLSSVGIVIPDGDRAETPQAAQEIASRLDSPTVIKALALVTGRAGRGWVRMAGNADETKVIAEELFDEEEVNALRVEKRLKIEKEFFAAVLVDDRAGKPVAVLSGRGGSGIEEIARDYPESVTRRHIDVREGLHPYMGREMAAAVGITGKAQVQMGDLMSKLYEAFRKYDCRSLEINPVVWTADEKMVAADCHAAVDDYAVYRHPEFKIKIAREIGHEPNEREMIAYQVEKHDYRGTFYFIQLADAVKGDNYVAFHGAGGGGSMMSMDALMKEGFRPANFCDTSGNPPASKVYRAAMIMLGMPGIKGYFASGSGVASQEQWQSAHGLIKAFREAPLRVPAVIRLGGNMEERAIELVHEYCKDLDVPVECYGKDTSARYCAERLRQLVDEYTPPAELCQPMPISPTVMPEGCYTFETMTGRVYIDQSRWTREAAEAVVAACPRRTLKIEDVDGRPHVVLAIDPDEVKKGKWTESISCELASFEFGCNALKEEYPLPTAEGYVKPGAAAAGKGGAK